jgi:hypothetical protein
VKYAQNVLLIKICLRVISFRDKNRLNKLTIPFSPRLDI